MVHAIARMLKESDMGFRRIAQIAVALPLWGLTAPVALAQHEHAEHRHAESQAKPTLPECPVSGEPVDFSFKTMTTEGPVYFCCSKCAKKFEANPDNYAKAVAEQRRALAALPRVQVACPVSGKPIDDEVFVERDGRKVFFCCQGCVSKYQKEPEKYQASLENSYTYQTKCPVMNEDIDPTASITLSDGRRIYFCCDGCDKKFLKDPAKYAAKLKRQGIRIDPGNIKPASTRSGDKPREKHDGHGHDRPDHGH